MITVLDGRPLLLTANHCIEGRDPSKFVFVFNYSSEIEEFSNFNSTLSFIPFHIIESS